MKAKHIALGFCTIVAVTGCRTESPRQPVNGDGCELACTIMDAYGCLEGKSPHCVGLCKRVQASGYMAFDIACIVESNGFSSLARCGVCH